MTDNTQVLFAVNSGRSKCDDSMKLLRRIFWLTVKFNCHLFASHVRGVDNIAADCLSRLCDMKSTELLHVHDLCCCRGIAEEGGVG